MIRTCRSIRWGRWWLGAAVLGCVIIAPACTSHPESPTIGTISPQGLAGSWRLELLQPYGQGAVLTPTSTTYTLTLTSSGTLSTRADCNTCGATFTLVGDSLTVAPLLTCTLAACSTASFQAMYTRILTGESTVGIAGSTMALVSSRGLLRFNR